MSCVEGLSLTGLAGGYKRRKGRRCHVTAAAAAAVAAAVSASPGCNTSQVKRRRSSMIHQSSCVGHWPHSLQDKELAGRTDGRRPFVKARLRHSSTWKEQP